MALFSQNQVIDVLISNSTNQVVVSDGTGGTVDAGDSLLFKQLLPDGTYRPTGIFEPKDVKYVSKVIGVTATPSLSFFSMTVDGAGFAHQSVITIDQWGSKSFEDQDFTPGEVNEVSGDTTATLSLKMVQSLAANFKNYQPSNGSKVVVPTAGYSVIYELDSDRPSSTSGAAGTYYYVVETGESFEGDGAADIDALVAKVVDAVDGTEVWVNPLFNFINTAAAATYVGAGVTGSPVTVNGNVFIVEKVPQRYVQGHIEYERLVFNTTYKVYDSINSDDYTVKAVTYSAGTLNPLDSRRVQDIEWFAMGNYGDLYDGAGYPNNFKREYISILSGTYTASYLVQLGRLGDGVQYGTESGATLQIFCQAAGDGAAVETALETALGITLPAGGGIVKIR